MPISSLISFNRVVCEQGDVFVVAIIASIQNLLEFACPICPVGQRLDEHFVTVLEFHSCLNCEEDVFSLPTSIEAELAILKPHDLSKDVEHELVQIKGHLIIVGVVDIPLRLNVHLGLNVRLDSDLPVIRVYKSTISLLGFPTDS